MKILILFFSIQLLLACGLPVHSESRIIFKDAFSGFKMDKNATPSFKKTNFKFENGKNIQLDNCSQVLKLNHENLAEYEVFRFRLVKLDCKALDKITRSDSFKKSYYPRSLNVTFFKKLPAASVPLLSEHDYSDRQEKTLGDLGENMQFYRENNHSVKIVTPADEYYISVLARADFNNDGIEDLLIKSEWYARHAHGKHADILIITRKSDNLKSVIIWRANKVE